MNERHKNCSLDTDYLCLNRTIAPATADLRSVFYQYLSPVSSGS